MSNHLSSYARLWHIANPLSEHTVALLGIATQQLRTENVASLPNLSDEGKKELTDAIKAFRTTHKDALIAHHHYISERFKPLVSSGVAVFGNIWANDEVFSRYHRAWKASMITSKIDIMNLPGWPPAHKEGDEIYDYTKDLKEEVTSIFTKASGGDPNVDAEKVEIPDLLFPDNLDLSTKSQLHIWILAFYNKYKDQDFANVINPLLNAKGLVLQVNDDPFFIEVRWNTEIALKDAELAYVGANKKNSDCFKAYMEKVKENVPAWVKDIENALSTSLKPTTGEGSKANEAGSSGQDKDSTIDLEEIAAGKKPAVEYVPASKIKYKLFDEKLRKVFTVPAAHRALLEVVPAPYMNIVDDKLVIKSFAPTVANIRIFMKNNDLDEAELDDASFATIVTILAHYGAIEANTVHVAAGGDPLAAKEGTRLSDVKIAHWRKGARRMLDASFAFASQGAKDGELSWYESFNDVYGRIMKPRRFIQICELIMASGYLESYAAHTDVSTILGANNVIGYRLIRLSSPTLVIEAFRLVDNASIYRMVDADKLKDYVQFDRGGILAQIAAGPLKYLCKGDIDVLTTVNIPSDVKIAELKAISAAPYHDRILRQAYIILDVYGKLPSKWYQGERAKRGMDARDTVFEAIVKAYKAFERKAAEDQVKETTDLVIEDILGDMKLYGEIKEILKMKEPSV